MPIDSMVEEVLVRWAEVHELTGAEVDVLRRATRGASVDVIALERGTTTKTVEKHVENILFKTGERAIASAVARVLREAAGLAA